jgi:probable rRNA maturation factor
MQELLEHLGRGTSELSILLTDDAGIADYNQRFLGRPGATNVISFGVDGVFSAGPDILGDIAVNIDAAKRQSEIRGVSPTDEILILCVHGLLHLLGFIHDQREGATENDRTSMELREHELLLHVGIDIDP